jgi:hypothetical protein
MTDSSCVYCGAPGGFYGAGEGCPALSTGAGCQFPGDGGEPDPETVCERCCRSLFLDEVEPVCNGCGLDGCCADCMAQHECEEGSGSDGE